MKLVSAGALAPGTPNYIFWYQPLKKRFPDLEYFDYARELGRKTRQQMNAEYLERMSRERVEFLLEVVSRGILYPSTLSKRLPQLDLAVHFFNDDEWQFDIFSRFICQYYHVVTTNNPQRVQEYAAFGKPAIFVQYACNHDLWRRLDAPKQFDVTFIGQPHSGRHRAIAHLRGKGISVRVFGAGWDRHPEMADIWGGYLSADDVVRVMNESRICLNFLTASTGDRMAIKARIFEINGCGSFQLCSAFDEVGRYYEIGKEIQVFHDMDDLVEKICYYLAHEDEREAIARAGYERTLREHTWDARYDHMFREIERLRPQLPVIPQPIISQKRVAVLYLAPRGRLAPATVASLNAQTLPNLEVAVVSDRAVQGAESLTPRWRRMSLADLGTTDLDCDLVAFIEDGEEWEPEKLQFQAFALEQDAAKGIECNLAQWGVFRRPGEPEFLSYVLRWLRDNHGREDLVPASVLPSALMVTADLFAREREALIGMLTRRDRTFAEGHFRDRAGYAHIELGVSLVRVPERRLWEVIAAVSRRERCLWINSALRYRSARYIPDLLRRLRWGRAWTLWRTYRLRQAGRQLEAEEGS